MRGRRALVLGLGRSGEAAALALHRAGAAVVVLDAADDAAAHSRAAALQRAVEGRADAARRIVVHLGADLDDPAPLDAADLVVPSPGVPPSRGLLTAAAERGLPVWSEVELAWQLAAGRTRLVAVTGTNGKTSTTELLAACLAAPTGGNIGTPLVTLLAADDPPPLVVAELSSFQLHLVETLHPEVAVLLNLAPDHLDWHGGLVAYGDAKARLWARHAGDDVVVVNRDDEGAAGVLARNPSAGRVVGSTLGAPAPGEVGIVDGVLTARLADDPVAVVRIDELALGAPHQVANACAAVAAALCAGATFEACAAALRAFRPGPHRLEHVADIGGVTYVNDSKATNPHAAAAALAAHDDIVLIAGGLAKGLDMAVLGPALAARARAVVTIGTSGPQIAALARGLGLEVVEAGALAAAVPAAARLAGGTGTVLLAPACASMDQFTDYAARGEAFRAAVAELAATEPPAIEPPATDLAATARDTSQRPTGASHGQ
jgi:UDP-N-acetylmuramoylalanine--D-glutamate ligase